MTPDERAALDALLAADFSEVIATLHVGDVIPGNVARLINAKAKLSALDVRGDRFLQRAQNYLETRNPESAEKALADRRAWLEWQVKP